MAVSLEVPKVAVPSGFAFVYLSLYWRKYGISHFLFLPQNGTLSETVQDNLKNWYTVAIEYLIRCQQSLQDNLRYLIYSVSFIYSEHSSR